MSSGHAAGTRMEVCELFQELSPAAPLEFLNQT